MVLDRDWIAESCQKEFRIIPMGFQKEEDNGNNSA